MFRGRYDSNVGSPCFWFKAEWDVAHFERRQRDLLLPDEHLFTRRPARDKLCGLKMVTCGGRAETVKSSTTCSTRASPSELSRRKAR